MTYDQAFDTLPANAEWLCSFGYPGKGGCEVRFRTPDGKKFHLSNGSWDDFAPFVWTVKEVQS